MERTERSLRTEGSAPQNGAAADSGDLNGRYAPWFSQSEDFTVRRLREVVDAGLLTTEQVEYVLDEQRRTKKSIVRVLLDLDYLAEDEIPYFLAVWKGLPYVDLVDTAIDASAASLVPFQLAQRHRMVPIGFDEDSLIVALSDPMNIVLLDDIRILTGRDVKVVVASHTDIEEALSRLSALDRATETLLEDTGEDDGPEIDEVVEEAPVVRAVHNIIAQAVQQRASDIHVEPEERDVAIRYRIDGVLHEVMRIPRSHQSGIISRLKVMADLNIAERRVPQDGRITMSVDNRPIDLRMATLPCEWGEEVVIRILDRNTSMISLEEMGFSSQALDRYVRSIRKTQGAAIVTGPTGSGKSTTIYGALNILNERSKKIVTIEDPVEYRLAGLRQLQVKPQIGVTFAAALRSILRSDPDIIMVGEIRDAETATIAVHAAMTGHLVLSSLHTKDSSSAATRLLEMGVEPFLVASALDSVTAQRLARRLCLRCSEPYEERRDVLEASAFPMDVLGDEPPKLRRPVGCGYCSKTGYRGRLAIAEVMPISESVERLIVERAGSDEIRRTAIQQGMQSLHHDGAHKALAGLTTWEEILRVLG